MRQSDQTARVWHRLYDPSPHTTNTSRLTGQVRPAGIPSHRRAGPVGRLVRLWTGPRQSIHMLAMLKHHGGGFSRSRCEASARVGLTRVAVRMEGKGGACHLRQASGPVCEIEGEGEGGACHLRQAPGLPATADRGVVGAPGSSRLLPIRPAPPDVTPCHGDDHSQRPICGRLETVQKFLTARIAHSRAGLR
jgi:hypothetical protein